MAGEDVLYPELERELAEIAARVAVDPSTFLGDFEVSESDRLQLAIPEHLQIIRESVTEVAATGVAGWGCLNAGRLGSYHGHRPELRERRCDVV